MRAWIGLAGAILLTSCAPGARPKVSIDTIRTAHRLRVHSSTFPSGGLIPFSCSNYGANVSPELSWSELPGSAKSVVVLVEDPDAPGGLFTHWILYEVPTHVRSLPAGQASNRGTLAVGLQGQNDAGGLGYFGPRPPDSKPHHYHFEVFALNVHIRRRPGFTRPSIYDTVAGHVVAAGEVVGVFTKPH